MGSQSYLGSLSQSCQKSISSAHMLTSVDLKFASSSVLQNFHQCSFVYFHKFSSIFERFMNCIEYITKYLKHSQTLVLIIIIIIIIYQAYIVPKVSFFVVWDVVYNKPRIYGGDYYLSKRLIKFETLDKV